MHYKFEKRPGTHADGPRVNCHLNVPLGSLSVSDSVLQQPSILSFDFCCFMCHFLMACIVWWNTVECFTIDEVKWQLTHRMLDWA